AVLSVFESILLRPLPYAHAARLVSVNQDEASRGISAWAAREWLAASRTIDSVALYTDGQMVLTGDGDAEVFRGQRVNAAFFDTLGVRLLLGRMFTAQEDGAPRAAVVVLSYELWSTRFAADPSAVGRTVM